MKRKLQFRVVGVNILGTLGYMSSLAAWILFAAVLSVLFMGSTEVVFVPSGDAIVNESAIAGLSTAVAYLVTGVMVLVTLVLVVVLPYLIGKLSSLSLRWLFRLLRIVPTKRTVFFAKSIVVVLPLVGFFAIASTITPSMGFSAIYIATVVAAAIALVLFTAQLIIARALQVPERLIW
jgi:hypothetical protein